MEARGKHRENFNQVFSQLLLAWFFLERIENHNFYAEECADIEYQLRAEASTRSSSRKKAEIPHKEIRLNGWLNATDMQRINAASFLSSELSMPHIVEHATLITYINHFHLTLVCDIARYILESAARNRRRSQNGDNQEVAVIESLARQRCPSFTNNSRRDSRDSGIRQRGA